MDRRHADHIYGQFDTPFGPMDFALTESNHVHVSAGGSHDPSPRITVNGIRYYASIHLMYKDRAWVPQHAIHLSREGGGPASVAADAKARAGIIEGWTAFIGDNQHLRAEAEVRHLNNEIIKVEEDIYALKHKIQKRHEELEALEYREGDAYAARAEFTKKGGFPKSKDWSPTGEVPGE